MPPPLALRFSFNSLHSFSLLSPHYSSLSLPLPHPSFHSTPLLYPSFLANLSSYFHLPLFLILILTSRLSLLHLSQSPPYRTSVSSPLHSPPTNFLPTFLSSLLSPSKHFKTHSLFIFTSTTSVPSS